MDLLKMQWNNLYSQSLLFYLWGKRTHNTVIMSTVIMGKNQRYKPSRAIFGQGIFEILISQSDEGLIRSGGFIMTV